MLEAVALLKTTTAALLEMMGSRPDLAMAVSVPYLKLCGYVAGGWLLAKSAAVAGQKKSGSDRDFYESKIRTALFFAEHVLPQAIALSKVVTQGASCVVETDTALV